MTIKKPCKLAQRKIAIGFLLTGLVLIGLGAAPLTASAQSPFHPTFQFLDQNGVSVLESGNPVSTMETCGQCHDTEFIAQHSFHSDAGLSRTVPAGETSSGRPWDTSPGLYGKWNPITYRYLSPEGDKITDLTTAEWIQTLGLRHVGGGPAQSEGIEMDCFLCHLSSLGNEERLQALQSGKFEWANTATLVESGIVFNNDQTYLWNQSAFDQDGNLLPEYITIQDPKNENCGQCHGTVHQSSDPLVLTGCEDTGWESGITGVIFAPSRPADSGMNLKDKETLSRSWDIHTERLLQCTNCHYSLNNPVYAEGSGEDTLEHLEFDPRRLDLGEYLYQPIHDFARGQSAQGTISPESKNTMRSCESCHNADKSHTWLPYTSQHMDALECETCHIPQLYNTAIQQVDWTVVEEDGTSRTSCRGVVGNSTSINSLVTGFTPAVLPQQQEDGGTKLAPYNLVSAWYWIYGNPARPVPQSMLNEVYLDGGTYKQGVVQVFDSNGNQVLDRSEMVIDSEEKEAFISTRLEDLGLENPRISAEIQPYSISHDVAGSEWAIRDCETCHTEDSKMAMPVQLAQYVPGGVLPTFVGGNKTLTDGKLYMDDAGGLYYQPTPQNQDYYVFGHNKVSWVDWFGTIMFLGVVAGISTHAGLRVYSAKKRAKHDPQIKEIYMYTFYERLWHWLQTITILVLAFTGLVIHKPEMFGIFSFNGIVWVHNIMAGILVANAALALFYNLVSGDIKRFIPEPHGFFNQSIVQAKYYLSGIFKGEEHPFEKSRTQRLNPLQKVTYFGILNVLLPLQTITGILMWGVQRWPQVAEKLGGLPFLAPFHTLVAWSFISFIVAHVYLTTTGHTPMAGIKSMIVGWDEVEVPSSESQETEEE
ncbi:MAG: cytochrome b/b6 domain-containing protein [Anaerolineales bacterium]